MMDQKRVVSSFFLKFKLCNFKVLSELMNSYLGLLTELVSVVFCCAPPQTTIFLASPGNSLNVSYIRELILFRRNTSFT